MIFFAPGIPAPQGSKTPFRLKNSDRVVLVESSKKVKPWRDAVAAAAAQHGFADTMLEGPVDVTVAFYLPRPKSHLRSDGTLKDSAPDYPRFPDTDKCLRSTLDALTQAKVWGDDSQVVRVAAVKQYTLDNPGALIEVASLQH